MPYHIVKPSVDSSEIGSVFPQVQKMSPNHDFNSNNSIYSLGKFIGKSPDITPDMNYFVLNNKAKLTDLLSTALLPQNGLLISEKLNDFLRNFHLIPHKLYEAIIQHKDKFVKYYWLHFITTLIEDVNYKESEFIIFLNYNHNLGPINIVSLEDFNIKKEKIKKDNPGKTVTIWAKKISFNENFNKKCDLFKIGVFDNDLYISDKLYEAISHAGITGISMTITDKLEVPNS